MNANRTCLLNWRTLDWLMSSEQSLPVFYSGDVVLNENATRKRGGALTGSELAPWPGVNLILVTQTDSLDNFEQFWSFVWTYSQVGSC
uniref:Uncharacterized protein n=1 Tax=Anguilla anguilla TaxID=7936 RepID=A0A0E9WYU2_ANGAN